METETTRIVENAIIVDAVTRHFNGLTAVSALSFAVPKGEIFGLLGPNFREWPVDAGHVLLITGVFAVVALVVGWIAAGKALRHPCGR